MIIGTEKVNDYVDGLVTNKVIFYNGEDYHLTPRFRVSLEVGAELIKANCPEYSEESLEDRMQAACLLLLMKYLGGDKISIDGEEFSEYSTIASQVLNNELERDPNPPYRNRIKELVEKLGIEDEVEKKFREEN